jgi:hypothetical protein
MFVASIYFMAELAKTPAGAAQQKAASSIKILATINFQHLNFSRYRLKIFFRFLLRNPSGQAQD